MEGRLVLCDIDGTLIDTKGAGLAALRGAALEVFGDEGPPLNLCGATDGGIIRGYLEHFGEDYCADRVEFFYRTYLSLLEKNFLSGEFDGELLPGVVELLQGLQSQGAALVLLTGNIERGARAKVKHFGLDQFFSVGAYGDDHHERDQLGPIALERSEQEFGRSFAPNKAIVLGDTPKDVQCGKYLGAATACVCTGSFNRSELFESGADLVLPDFYDHHVALLALEALGSNE